MVRPVTADGVAVLVMHSSLGLLGFVLVAESLICFVALLVFVEVVGIVVLLFVIVIFIVLFRGSILPIVVRSI